jgi:hypothetical protein
MATTMPGVARDANRWIVRSAARGAGLIGAAVVLGIILLQVVDDGSGGPAGNGNGDTPTITTGADGTTDSTAPTDTRPVGEVRVLALNAGGPDGAAGGLANTLRAGGYNVLTAGNDPVARQGLAVACRQGFESDANALVLAVTSALGTQPTPEPFPTDREADLQAQDADCIVFIGQT